MRRTCASRTAGSFSLPCSATLQQLVVRNAAPEEERQPRRELEVADAIGRAGRRRSRIALDAEDELRRRENPLERRFDARSRTCLL